MNVTRYCNKCGVTNTNLSNKCTKSDNCTIIYCSLECKMNDLFKHKKEGCTNNSEAETYLIEYIISNDVLSDLIKSITYYNYIRFKTKTLLIDIIHSSTKICIVYKTIKFKQNTTYKPKSTFNIIFDIRECTNTNNTIINTNITSNKVEVTIDATESKKAFEIYKDKLTIDNNCITVIYDIDTKEYVC